MKLMKDLKLTTELLSVFTSGLKKASVWQVRGSVHSSELFSWERYRCNYEKHKFHELATLFAVNRLPCHSKSQAFSSSGVGGPRYLDACVKPFSGRLLVYSTA